MVVASYLYHVCFTVLQRVLHGILVQFPHLLDACGNVVTEVYGRHILNLILGNR